MLKKYLLMQLFLYNALLLANQNFLRKKKIIIAYPN